MADRVQLTKRGNIAIITLNAPKKLNSMNQDAYYALSCTMRAVAAMPDISITILTGTGRFFSAGADVNNTRPGGEGSSTDADATRREIMRGFVSNNLDITRSFYTHPKILITALNGPTVGLSAAIVAHSDFVYATPHTFLLTPFSSLGLVAEGGASVAMVQRLGIAKANEALIMSKKITCEELVQTGFVNKVFKGKDVNDSEGFLKQVLEEVNERLGDHLNQESLVKIKELIRKPYLDRMESNGVLEVIGGMERFMSGAPTREFQRLASGQKKHKL